MHIIGTAYRAAYAISLGMDPTTWIIPENPVDMRVSLDSETPIGTANLTRDSDGTIECDAEIDEVYRRWTRARTFLDIKFDEGRPPAILYVGVVSTNADPDLLPWTEVFS